MTLADDTRQHLQRQLVLSLRVASDRIAELERKCHAYEAVIESFEARAVTLKSRIQSLRLWPWVALLATSLSAIFSLS